MKYNPKIHHRRSIRLKGYDYSQAGLYFITICVKNWECLYGHISNGEMILNDAGKMVEKWYYELENKFPDIRCDEMIVMPNHFHCIIENVGTVGADLRVCPDNHGQLIENTQSNMDAPTDGEQPNLDDNTILGDASLLGEHIGSPLHRVMQWFKTMSTNEYIRGVKNLGWPPFAGKLWQRNYYERIIRNERAYRNIANYIVKNPENWREDNFY